jgi:hypothetical protein
VAQNSKSEVLELEELEVEYMQLRSSGKEVPRELVERIFQLKKETGLAEEIDLGEDD